MIAFYITVLMAIIGIVVGIIYTYRSVTNNLKQTRQDAKDYIERKNRETKQEHDQLVAENNDESQDYRKRVNEELDSQSHNNYLRESRLRQREQHLNQEEIRLNDLSADIDELKKQHNDKKDHYQSIKEYADQLIKDRRKRLNQQSQLDDETTRDLVLNQTANNLKREQDVEVNSQVEHVDSHSNQIANNIIVDAIQNGPTDLPRNHIERSVNVPSLEIRKFLLNRNHQHLRLLESLTGTDLLFDTKNPLLLYISTQDPIRREIVRRALDDLMVARKITNNNIELQVRKAEREVMYELRSTGEKVVKQLDLNWMHPDLMKIIGRLKYRTSYGQNVLYHSLEVAQLAGVMAAELGLDVQLAKRAGLLHDSGKAIDHEINGTHVELGVKLAETYDEDPTVINTIGSHHGDVEPNNSIALLISTADALSGARPGARSESVEDYINRLKSLENIANHQDGVADSYAIQAGRELRIIVDPSEMDDNQSHQLTQHVRDQVEDELTYPGKIKITTIRKLNSTQYVGGNPHHNGQQNAS